MESRPPALPWTLKRTLRLASYCAIAFVLAVSPIIVAYVAHLSKLSVSINNLDQELAARAVVYVDDEPVWTITIPPASQVIRSMKVPAGWHNIGIDSAIPGRTANDLPDGKMEWSTAVKVKPMIGVLVSTDIGYLGWGLRTGSITVTPGPSETVVTFNGFTAYMNGQQYPAEVPWYDIEILVTDGTSWIGWNNLTNSDLAEITPPAMAHYGFDRLGNLDVWLNLTDLAADGHAGAGDFFTLDAGNGSFDSDTTYTVYIIDETVGGLICKTTF